MRVSNGEGRQIPVLTCGLHLPSSPDEVPASASSPLLIFRIFGAAQNARSLLVPRRPAPPGCSDTFTTGTRRELRLLPCNGCHPRWNSHRGHNRRHASSRWWRDLSSRSAGKSRPAQSQPAPKSGTRAGEPWFARAATQSRPHAVNQPSNGVSRMQQSRIAGTFPMSVHGLDAALPYSNCEAARHSTALCALTRSNQTVRHRCTVGLSLSSRA